VFDHYDEGMLVIHLYLSDNRIKAPRFSLQLEYSTFAQLADQGHIQPNDPLWLRYSDTVHVDTTFLD
jgi:hypothetical protein